MNRDFNSCFYRTTTSPPKMRSFPSLRSSKRAGSLVKAAAASPNTSQLKMSRKLDGTNSSIPVKNDLHHERNSLVVLGCLAEKLGSFNLFKKNP